MSATPVVAFNAERQPLDGRCLIEASAGTGKTYAITSLVLRLLLGHRGHTTGVAPLRIEQILIVTFTRAATEELRGRIRERLQTALAAFAEGSAPVGDELVATLRRESANLEADRNTLDLAVRSLDLASILTIHSFAGRVLQRNAFESRVSFGPDIGEDDAAIMRETVFDFWRERVYPLPDALAGAILDEWSSPAKFARDVAGLLLRKHLAWLSVPAADWQGLLTDLAREEALLLAAAQDPAAVQACSALLPRLTKKGSDSLTDFLSSVTRGALRLRDLKKLDPELLEAQQAAKFKDKTGKPTLPPVPVLAQAARLGALAELLPQRLLHDAVQEVAARLAERKARTAELGFDDLLRLLSDGLDARGTGDRLAALILEQYPAALVDECQDTDPLQWKIFDRIYRDAGALFLVGDPKQAIYSFRGADVYAYLKARRAATELCSLGISWRSTHALVEALNALFSLRDDGDAFCAPGLFYTHVRASGTAEEKPLLRIAEPLAPLQILGTLDGESRSADDYRESLAPAVADHIAGMLADGAAGHITLNGKPLAPGDIAILVRSWRDAVPLTRALSRRGVPVVSRARDSVYESAAADGVLALLRAVLEPRAESALRAALASTLAGRNATELETLFTDETQMLAMQETFATCRDRLRARGVQPMFRQLFRELDVPARALAAVDGERLLTDALHLVELLAAERATLDSDEALLARFAERMANADGNREEQQLRLESDARRVRILSIHASKGLEFPVVVLPFAAQCMEQKTPLFHNAQTLQPVYDLAWDRASLDAADEERLAEDLRLLYVALTRAKHCCVIGVADPGQRGKSTLAKTALGWLLGADGCDSRAALRRLLDIPGAHFVGMPASAILPPVPLQPGQLAARPLLRKPDTRWRSSSYSALASHRPDAERAARVFRQWELEEGERDRKTEIDYSAFGFPRGPDYGDMLHKVLERVDFTRPAADPANAELIRAALARIGLGEDSPGGAGRWLDVVAGMIEELRTCPLDGVALRLCDVPARQRIPEMRFELPVDRLDASSLTALMRAHDSVSAEAGDLGFAPLHGMLSGSMDLVFRHEGRFYVADYKSNHLGASLADYGAEQQRKVIAEHRYDLQYTLYTVALARYLRARMGDQFDYDAHVGGVYYLFLRGIRHEDANRQGVFFTRPARALVEALDAMLGQVAT